MTFRGFHRLQVTRKWRRKPLESLQTDSEMAAHLLASGLRAVTPRSAREWQLSYDVSVEIEGTQKPALAATWLTMQVMAAI